ncbi:serine hydrolase domain-containing protein [Nitrospirillum pindoramense]|uniref:CubicO group peptidase (Beta-lactamase class C family) n=1 Tax=Nitrospirillum amazonense TaxID=28077 RepID=A0A560GQN8_9PROT|nr:serine hydrolase [Nitrospirillum amazonense]TWB35854.1 CubicO group peptidase (beta-lactamase class C family) [Nitrospirillum amazonense]
MSQSPKSGPRPSGSAKSKPTSSGPAGLGRAALLLVPVAALAIGGGLLLAHWGKHGDSSAPPPSPPPPVAAEPPAPRGPVTVEVAGGDGPILTVASPDDRQISDEGLKALHAFESTTGTTALLVWYRGALQVEDYGPGIRPADLMEGAGLQAGVLTFLTGKAIQDGFLTSADQPLGQIFPDWKDDPRGRITVRDLLVGSSGLGFPAGTADAPAGKADAGAWLKGLVLEAEPGTRYKPAEEELQVLALVLERATKQPLAAYMSQALWGPLGARPAEMLLDDSGRATLVGCCVKATARDWLRLGLLLKDGGQVENRPVIPMPWVEEMQRPTLFARNEGMRIRIAWPREKGGPIKAAEAFAEPDTVFMAGAGGQRLYVSKAADLVILRLGRVVQPWDDAALVNLVARHLERPPEPKRTPYSAIAVQPQGLAMPPIVTPRKPPVVVTVPLDAPHPPAAQGQGAAPGAKPEMPKAAPVPGAGPSDKTPHRP